MFSRKLACSFCGRDNSDVAKLVAGPRVFICDRCAYETVRIMETRPLAKTVRWRVTDIVLRAK